MSSRAERRPRRSVVPLLGAVALSAVLALAPSCLDRRSDEGLGSTEARCATCHGDAKREGDFLSRAAPPSDLLATNDSSYPGVGAHALHLAGSETHGAVACTECHVIPETTESKGHADDARPAEIVFGALARTGGQEPSYDAVARTCSDSYCHREAAAVWTEPRTPAQACGSCHGLPPPAPHPQSENCFTCHGQVVDAERRFIAPELHVDGTVQVVDGGCMSCHGSGGDPAPPADLSGRTQTSAPGVGAHQAHLLGTPRSRPVPCAECHSVPNATFAAGHLDTPPPAELTFSGAANAYGGSPVYASGACTNTSCHGGVFPAGHASGGSNTAPLWTSVDGTQATCGACHGLPPPRPHPKVELNPICSACHENIASDNATFVRPELHVDGVVTFVLP